jgi:hypothetical protein
MDLPLYPGLVVEFATKLPVELPIAVTGIPSVSPSVSLRCDTGKGV